MRNITIVLIFLVLGASCTRKVPDDVVPQEQMKALLLDMHLADGQLTSMLIDSARVYRDAYYDAIFDRYGIDSTEFKHSLDFYSTRPQLMKEIYLGIEQQLDVYNKEEEQAMTAQYSEQRRADSLVNARRADSLRTVMRDSLDFKRKRYLLFLDGPDSLQYGRPLPVTHSLLLERMMETIGLGGGVRPLRQPDTARTQPVKTTETDRTPEPEARPEATVKPITTIN